MNFSECKPQNSKESFLLFLSLVISQLAGLIWTPIIAGGSSTWFQQLSAPFFNPPSWVFGPVWTLLYVLIGLTLYLVYKSKDIKKNEKHFFYGLFIFQLILNSLWTPLFFSLHAIGLALIEILFLLSMITFILFFLKKKLKLAFYLWLPYVLWVAFASILNFSFFILN
jgi:tryptophan-rich sensory protein